LCGHPPSGLDGEAAALGTQIISVINIATGVMPIDQRANFISTGGFEVGIQIRGPNSESGFMEALTTGLTSIGHLKEVRVNGLSIRPMLAGPVTVGGPATMSGGINNRGERPRGGARFNHDCGETPAGHHHQIGHHRSSDWINQRHGCLAIGPRSAQSVPAGLRKSDFQAICAAPDFRRLC
jgi:hypothetical protein